MHVVPPAQTFPHVPQFAESASPLTHCVPQVIHGAEHVQVPPTQGTFAAQVIPHAPQLVRSEVTSMHAPWQ